MTSRNLTATEAKRLNRDWRRRTERPVGLILDNVQSPYNVGAILRTAAAFRLDHLWLAGATATPDHEKTRKTSLGTERLVAWSVVATPADAATDARSAGMRIIGIELASGAVSIAEVPLEGPICLVVGHEDHGLSAGGLAVCDAFAYVPTPGKVGSLNVATAAAIALYEVRRREWGQPAPS